MCVLTKNISCETKIAYGLHIPGSSTDFGLGDPRSGHRGHYPTSNRTWPPSAANQTRRFPRLPARHHLAVSKRWARNVVRCRTLRESQGLPARHILFCSIEKGNCSWREQHARCSERSALAGKNSWNASRQPSNASKHKCALFLKAWTVFKRTLRGRSTMAHGAENPDYRRRRSYI